MNANLATGSYIGATILFILSLGGLSNPETSRRGNLYGMIGMTIAVLATVLGPQVTKGGYAWILAALVVGAAAGSFGAGAGHVTAPSLMMVRPRIASSSILTLMTPSFVLQSSSARRNRLVE